MNPKADEPVPEDRWLREALRHAPDAEPQVPAALRSAILDRARRAAAAPAAAGGAGASGQLGHPSPARPGGWRAWLDRTLRPGPWGLGGALAAGLAVLVVGGLHRAETTPAEATSSTPPNAQVAMVDAPRMAAPQPAPTPESPVVGSAADDRAGPTAGSGESRAAAAMATATPRQAAAAGQGLSAEAGPQTTRRATETAETARPTPQTQVALADAGAHQAAGVRGRSADDAAPQPTAAPARAATATPRGDAVLAAAANAGASGTTGLAAPGPAGTTAAGPAAPPAALVAAAAPVLAQSSGEAASSSPPAARIAAKAATAPAAAPATVVAAAPPAVTGESLNRATRPQPPYPPGVNAAAGSGLALGQAGAPRGPALRSGGTDSAAEEGDPLAHWLRATPRSQTTNWAGDGRTGTLGDAQRRWLGALRDATAGRWAATRESPPASGTAVLLIGADDRIARVLVEDTGLRVWLQTENRMFSATVDPETRERIQALRQGW